MKIVFWIITKSRKSAIENYWRFVLYGIWERLTNEEHPESSYFLLNTSPKRGYTSPWYVYDNVWKKKWPYLPIS